MPLHILLILVVGGIAGIALALHLLGLSRATPLTEDTARAAWLRHWPDDAVHSVHVTQDGRAARVEARQGRGILWQFGADTCARRLTGAEVTRIVKGRVDLRLGDYTAPRVRLALSPSEQDEWTDWMTKT
ncbi:MAG: hypothetical protein AAFY39_10510 [Pseudomonadota bacterium]